MQQAVDVEFVVVAVFFQQGVIHVGVSGDLILLGCIFVVGGDNAPRRWPDTRAASPGGFRWRERFGNASDSVSRSRSKHGREGPDILLMTVHAHEPRSGVIIHVGVVNILVQHMVALRSRARHVFHQPRHLLNSSLYRPHTSILIVVIITRNLTPECAHDCIHALLDVVEDALYRKHHDAIGHRNEEGTDKDKLGDYESHQAHS
mmetsp:Transcript_33633/g.53973  ORF Transcript_33633/g.53973 Transcript_33633/m.53973 type:complete len:204 (+) Transcript_33633:786-1397(+)